MRGPLPLLLGSAALVAALYGAFLLTGDRDERARPAADTTLEMYCAAGISKPIQEIAEQYRDEYGVEVQLQFGGSGTLLNNLQVAKQGDIYLAADSSYLEIAAEKGLTDEQMTAATLLPVIVVKQDNPKGITGADDLLRDDVRVSLANPDAASVGKTAMKLFQSLGIWDELEARVTDTGVFKPTVNEVASDVELGSVDAGVVWDATAGLFDEVEVIDIEGGEDFEKTITLGLLQSTQHPTETLRFMRYVTARDRGLEVFAKHGFNTVNGDVWAERPEIVYYSGGVNRVAIEDTLAAFSEREGVDITTTYNGCGILVGQIQAGGNPDVYHTCDASFMNPVFEQFETPDYVSKTDIVILVQEGNPKGIETLEDLTREGLQVGVCTEELSTLGTMTAKLLHEVGLYDGVQKNVVVTNPQGDLLVTQLTLGKLDAAIVYYANTMFVQDETDVIPIDAPGSVATQTYAVAKGTKYHHLLERLRHQIRDAQSAERYQQAGFTYLEEAGQAVTL